MPSNSDPSEGCHEGSTSARSVVFVDCVVIRLRATNPLKMLHNWVDIDTFVKVICEDCRAGVDAGDNSSLVVYGTLKGGRLEELRSHLGSRN